MNPRITLKLQDFQSLAAAGQLAEVIGRETELAGLARSLLQPTRHHVLVVGEPGSGKTSLVESLFRRAYGGHYRQLAQPAFRLHIEPIIGLLANGSALHACEQALEQAGRQIGSGFVIIEDLQLLTATDPNRLELALTLLHALAARPGLQLITTCTTDEYYRLLRDDYRVGKQFNTVMLATATPAQSQPMVEAALPALAQDYDLVITAEAVAAAIDCGHRYGQGCVLPEAALRWLEEACAWALTEGQAEVTADGLRLVVAERIRIPLERLQGQEQSQLRALEQDLREQVIGQDQATRRIAQTLQLAGLGLAEPGRPRGSFLVLGPSGVGKTETAKALVRLLWDDGQALIRLDMSEYGQPHDAARLTGAAPGYIGYDQGGQLTNPVARQPYSLVLLDEIEKAHPKLLDVFLQVLDDGRLTDSAGKTVDFSQTVIVVTSNTATAEITAAAQRGEDIGSPEFLHRLMPLLMRQFRPEFLNRFDAILVYRPLGEAELLRLAHRELAKLEQRLAGHQVRFKVSDDLLARLIRSAADPRLGARPVKRLVSRYFEAPLANQLLQRGKLPTATITGEEPWIAAA